MELGRYRLARYAHTLIGLKITLYVLNILFPGDDLAFLVSNRTAFELPLATIANSNIAGKTEVSLEFANIEGGVGGKKKSRANDELVEMRFYVPGTHTKEGEDDEDPEEETSAAQAFHDMIKEKAEIGQVSGESIVVFNEVLVLTPRYVSPFRD